MLATRRLCLFILCLLSLTSAFSQSETYQVDGIVEDTLGNPLIYATVLLLEEADSTLLDFTRTEVDGSFRFKDIQPGDHLIKTTYVGYLPLTIPIDAAGQKKVDLGTLKMSEIASELMEVVIKAARAPMKMRGDTIEYDASTFKVPEGSTVEELLRRLPGIEVESDGSINADGKAVDKVTVDGKSFFGSDPKAATKNLPAEGVAKVQVFDSKTEEEEVTGIKGDSENKTMNLELKEEFKSGGFGKIIAGVGDVNRKELKGNYNKFNDKIQLSLIGVGNNTGRNGLSWDDYQDFMGSNSWNFDGGTDYGFGGRRNMIVFGGNRGSSIEQTVQNLFFSDGQKGFPENYNAGVSFNFDNKKDKVTSVYYFNQANLDANSMMDQDKFFQNFTQNETREDVKENRSQGHRVELTYERELDSLHSVKLDMKGAVIDETVMNRSQVNLSRDVSQVSSSSFLNNTNTTGNLFNGTAIFKKKFQRKGRRAGANVSYLTTALEDVWTQESDLNFTDQDTVVMSEVIDQQNNTNADKQVLKANAIYVEPFSKKIFLQSFYNYRKTSEGGDRFIGDIVDDETIQNNFLSREYENSIVYNRAGTALRYSHAGINVTVGGAFQKFDLQGTAYDFGRGQILGEVDKQFDQFIPHISIGSSYNRKMRINASYTRSANEPYIPDMQPIVENLNPLYVRIGNPNLVPEISDSYRLGFSNFWPMQDTRFNINLRYEKFDKQFSTAESVDDRLVTTYQPINVDGGSTIWGWASVNFPIRKNKLKMRVNYSYNLNNRTSLINQVENDTRVITHNPRIKIDVTPSEHFTIYLEGGISLSNTSYALFSELDQATERLTGSAEINAKLFAGIFISSQLSYSKYSNDRFGLSQVIPIWDSSIYRFFMPDNRLELRFSIYDALNKNLGINQSAYGISVSQSQTETLARYGMLSLTYNMRGMKTDVRKQGWW